jgi:hypothetical protein
LDGIISVDLAYWIRRKGMEKEELEGRVRVYLRREGYEIYPERCGFDIFAVKRGAFNTYLGVGCNAEEEVTKKYVRDFMGKISSLDAKSWFSQLEGGLIAYSGHKPKTSAALVKGNKPRIRFRKS